MNKDESDKIILPAKILTIIVGILGLAFIYWAALGILVPREYKICSSWGSCSTQYPSYLFPFSIPLSIIEAIGFLALFLAIPILAGSVISLTILMSPSLRSKYSKDKAKLLPYIILGFIGVTPTLYWTIMIGIVIFSAWLK